MQPLMRFFLLFFATVFCINAAFAQNADALFAQSIYQHRKHYAQEFLEEPRAPLKVQDTAYLDFFAPSLAWQITALFERTPEASPFDMATYSGQKAKYVQYGTLRFELDGKEQTLRIYQNLRLAGLPEYADYLFLPFKDQTNGETSYGGGRYLDFRVKDISADGKLLLDFNKAYNPYCAYSDGYSCPIPPRENHLELNVTAGEKLFRKADKH